MWTACFLLLLLGPAIGHGGESTLHEEREISDDLESRSDIQNEELRPKRQFFSDFTTPNPASRRRFSPVVRKPSHRRVAFSSPIPESTTRANRPRHEGPEVDLSSFEFRRTVPRNPILYTPSYRIRNSEYSSGESTQQLRKGSRRRNGHSESTTKRSVTIPVNQADFGHQISSFKGASLPSVKEQLDNTYTLETVSSLPDSKTETTTTLTNDRIKLRKPSLRSSSTAEIPLTTTMETVPALIKFLESGEDDNGPTTETTVPRPTPATIGSSIFNRRPGFRLLNKAQTLSTSTVATSSKGVDDHLTTTKDIEVQGEVSMESSTAPSTSFLPVTNRLVKFRRPFLKPLNKSQTLPASTTTAAPTGVYVPLPKVDNDASLDITTTPATSVIPETNKSTKYRRPFLKPLTKFQTYSVTSTTETPIEVEVPVTLSTTENLESQVAKAGGDATANSSVETSTTKFERERNGIVKLRRPVLKPFSRVPVKTELPSTPVTTTTEMTTLISTSESDAGTSSIENYSEKTSKDKITSEIEGFPDGIQTSTPIKTPLDLRKYKEIKRKTQNVTRADGNRSVTESDVSLTTTSANDGVGAEFDNLRSPAPKTPIMTSILKKFTKFKLPVFSLARKPAATSKDTITPNIKPDTMTNVTDPAVTEDPEHLKRKYGQDRLPAFSKATIISTKKGKTNQDSDTTTNKVEFSSQDTSENFTHIMFENNSTKHVEDATNEPVINQFDFEENIPNNQSSNFEKQNPKLKTSREEGYLTNGEKSDTHKPSLTSSRILRNESLTFEGNENTNTLRSRTLFSNKKLKEVIATANGNSNVVRPASPYPVFGNKSRNRTLHFLRNNPLGVKNDNFRKSDENERKVENSRFFVSATTIDENTRNISQVDDKTISHRKLPMSTEEPIVLKMNARPNFLSEDSTLRETEDIENTNSTKEVLKIAELKSDQDRSLKIEESNETHTTLYDPMVYENESDRRLRLHLGQYEKNQLPSKIVVTIQHVDPSRETEEAKHSSLPILDISENGYLEYKTDKVIVTVQVTQFKENKVDPVCKTCNNKTTFHLSFQHNMTDIPSVIIDGQEESILLQSSGEDGAQYIFNQTRTNVNSSIKNHPTQIKTEAIVHNSPSLNTYNEEKMKMVLYNTHTTSLPLMLTTMKENESTSEEFKNQQTVSDIGSTVITSERQKSSSEELFLPASKEIESTSEESLSDHDQTFKTSEEKKSYTEELFHPQYFSTETSPALDANNTEMSVSIIPSIKISTEHTTDELIIPDKPKENPSVTNNEIENSTTIPTTEMFSSQTYVPETSDDGHTSKESATEIVTTEQYTTINLSEIFGFDNIINSDKEQVAMGKHSSEDSLDSDNDEELLYKLFTENSKDTSPVIEETITDVEVNETTATNEDATENLEILGAPVTPMTSSAEELADTTDDDEFPFTYGRSTGAIKVVTIPITGMTPGEFMSFAETFSTAAPENRNRNEFLGSGIRSPQSDSTTTEEEETISPTTSEILLDEINGNVKMSHVLNKGESEVFTASKISQTENQDVASNIVTETSPDDKVTADNTEIPVDTEITTEIGRTTMEENVEAVQEEKRRIIIDAQESTATFELITEKYVVLEPKESFDMEPMMPIIRNESTSENVIESSVSFGVETVENKVQSDDSVETGSQDKTEETEPTMEDVITTTDMSNTFHRFVLGADTENMRSETEPANRDAVSTEPDEFSNDVFGTEETTTKTSENVTNADWSGIQSESSTTVGKVEALDSIATTVEPLGPFE